MHSTLGPVMVHTPSYTLDSVQLFLDQIIDFSMHCVWCKRGCWLLNTYVYQARVHVHINDTKAVKGIVLE